MTIETRLFINNEVWNIFMRTNMQEPAEGLSNIAIL